MERRLAAILSADVVGYSRLMGEDEAATLAALKTDRQELFDPKAREYNGRVIKLMGDGALMEFPSVVEAVGFAVECQLALKERNAARRDGRPILYRIGINIGDIIVEDGDIFGDGVNVAARVEALAEPGGICVSENVRDQVRDKLDIGFDEMGEVAVKNIARPVRPYNVVLDDKAAALATPVAPIPAAKRRRWPRMAAALVLLVALAGGGAWLWWSSMNPAPGGVADAPQRKPVVAILPLDNLSSDPEHQHFADGLTEELTARLSRFSDLAVIARNSASRYKGEAVDLREVSRELGAGYVLEGSVRRSPDRIKVTVQLIDGGDGAHLWSESYDRPLGAQEIFDIQDEIASSIASSIGGLGGVVRKSAEAPGADVRPDDMAAYDCTVLNYRYWDTIDPKVHAQARDCHEAIVARHPNYSLAWAHLAYLYYAEFSYRANAKPDPLERALNAAQRAIELDPSNEDAFGALSDVQFGQRNAGEALAAIERAVALNPNSAGLNGNALCKYVWLGQFDKAGAALDRARALDPFPPWWIPICASLLFYALEDYEGSLRELNAYSGADLFGFPYQKSLALAELGRLEEAAAEVAKANAIRPSTLESLARRAEYYLWTQPELQARAGASAQKAGYRGEEEAREKN